MAKARSPKSPFPSIHCPGIWVTPSAYLAEIVVSRMAQKKGEALSGKFWSTAKWKKTFQTQLRFATALLKLYPVQAILKVLNGKGKNVYSLRTGFADAWYAEEASKMTRVEPTEPVEHVEETIRERPIDRTPLSRLRDLDG